MKIAFITFMLIMTAFTFGAKYMNLGRFRPFLEEILPVKLAHVFLHVVGGILVVSSIAYVGAIIILILKFVGYI